MFPPYENAEHTTGANNHNIGVKLRFDRVPVCIYIYICIYVYYRYTVTVEQSLTQNKKNKYRANKF